MDDRKKSVAPLMSESPPRVEVRKLAPADERPQSVLVSLIFIEELAPMIGKSVTTIRTCSSNQKYHHLIPRPRKLPNSRRLCWTREEVAAWIDSTRPAEPPALRRARGRPTKAEQLSRLRWAEGRSVGKAWTEG